jgi:hypothetical protein
MVGKPQIYGILELESSGFHKFVNILNQMYHTEAEVGSGYVQYLWIIDLPHPVSFSTGSQ